MSLHKDLAKIALWIEAKNIKVALECSVEPESIEYAVDQLRQEAQRKSGDYRLRVKSTSLLRHGQVITFSTEGNSIPELEGLNTPKLRKKILERCDEKTEMNGPLKWLYK